ncbi:MAG TPA: hypothetical protein ENN80_05210, partial [Candidatus Hydrogenedentes bacterium]|nr:hypothetical protein [Candidatus Hydrogenedentota bacterium]
MTVAYASAAASSAEGAQPDEGADRIARLRGRYHTGPAYVSIDRARYYTESWRETEDQGIALSVRVALAMKRVYERMRHYVDADDRIAGYWTEHFLGVPIDVERGVFNEVLAAELAKGSMVYFRTRSFAKGLAYMLRKGSLGEFLQNQRYARESGNPPLNVDFKTMDERAINPYQIALDDRRLLLRDLLPYWRGRCVVDKLQRGMIDSGLYSKDMHDFVVGIPGNTSRQVFMVSAAATIASYQGHVILDFDRVLEQGLEAMHAEAVRRRDRLAGSSPEHACLASIVIALEGVMIYARRLAEAVATKRDATSDPEARQELDALAVVCRRVPLQPPRTFREAVQALWTVKTAVELAHPVNLHSFGRLDQNLHPFYKADLEAQRLSSETAREVIEELLLKIMSQNIRPESNMLANFYHRYLGSSPVTLGGVTRDGVDATNDLTYLFLDAAHRSKAITNVSLRVHPGTPDDVFDRVAAYLHDGTSSFSLFNDVTMVEAMRRCGFADEDARDYAVMGCVEATCPGKTGGMNANALLLSKVLDMALRNGDARTIAGTIRHEGPETGAADSFETFEQLLDAFFAQARQAIGKIVEASNLRDKYYAEHLPAPCISAFVDGCLDSMKDITAGGARYDLSGISMINSIANLTDSLYVIRKLVFEEKKLELPKLLDAVDGNFRDHEAVLSAIRSLPGKWGNGEPEADALARSIMRKLIDETHRHRSFRGGPFVVYVISMTTHTI